MKSELFVHKKLNQDKIDEVYRKYHALVNMSASQLEKWAENPCSKGASLSRGPIKRNLRLLRTPKAEWGAAEVRSANRTISFISRMKGAEQGEPVKVDGKTCPSKRDISLRNWAYNPSSKSKQITAEEQTEEDADKLYSDTLKGLVRSWEREVNRMIIAELTTADMDKSFSDLIRRLADVFTTNKYTDKIVKAIRYHYKQGIQDAEDQMGVDVGMTDAMNQEITQITQRQLDGFAVGDTVWNGIKGMSNDVRKEVIEAITQSMNEGTSYAKLRTAVHDVMQKYYGTEVQGVITQGRVERIARTEANRIRNEGRLKTYVESQVKGRVVWNAVGDSKTSEICRELDGKSVPVGENFYSEVSGQYYKVPPAHVNCRSRVDFIPED